MYVQYIQYVCAEYEIALPAEWQGSESPARLVPVEQIFVLFVYPN